MWKRPYKAVRCASKSRPSKKGTQRCSEYLRTGRAGTKGNEYLLSILPRQLELTHKEDHIANSKEGTGQMGNTNVIHMAVQNSRQHPSLDRHCFEKWVIFVHRLRLDPLRMILEIASSVAENPVLRLDWESWTLAHFNSKFSTHQIDHKRSCNENVRDSSWKEPHKSGQMKFRLPAEELDNDDLDSCPKSASWTRHRY